MNEILEITKALGDESRLRALLGLRARELCLCQLIELLGLAPSTVSKHMAQLAQAGLVRRRKEGRWHFYRLAGASASPVARAAIEWVTEAARGETAASVDAARIEEIMTRDLEELSACYRS